MEPTEVFVQPASGKTRPVSSNAPNNERFNIPTPGASSRLTHGVLLEVRDPCPVDSSAVRYRTRFMLDESASFDVLSIIDHFYLMRSFRSHRAESLPSLDIPKFNCNPRSMSFNIGLAKSLTGAHASR